MVAGKNSRYLTTIKNQSHEKYLYRNRVPNGDRACDIGTATAHHE
jgi:hypothetical protein